MKGYIRGIALALLLTMICNLTACVSPKSQEEVLPEAEQAEEQTAEELILMDREQAEKLEESNLLCENLPKMDGSTSLIPLEAGLRAALCGISMEERFLTFRISAFCKYGIGFRKNIKFE